MGGLSKKGFQFNQIATDSGKPHLTLDAGNLLFKHDTINPKLEAQEKLTAEAIVEAYNLIGYQAVGVGSKDLIAGIPYLQALAKKAKFTWLSANLVAKTSKKPLFKASTTLKVGSIKAGVIGITGQLPLASADQATLLSWEEVLPRLVAKVAKRHDLVILLSNLPAAENQRIAEAHANIHLIIQSGATSNTISPGPINNTLLASTGPQGKQVGILTINWQPGKRWGDQKAELLAKKKGTLDRLLWQLSKYQQDKDPETALRNQPDQLKAYQILKAREQELRDDIERMTKEFSKAPPSKGEPSSFGNRFLAMETNLPDQPEIARLTDRLDAAIQQLGQQKAKDQNGH